MPSFAGFAIFGAAPKIVTVNEDRMIQVNTFFGLDGLETLDGGFRGRITTASGLLFGDTPFLCATAVENFRSFDNGSYNVLVDTAGVSWPFVRLRSFRPQDRAFAHTQLGYTRAYTAVFHHLA